ncbi:MAG: rhodanese-like domain-containing protein [Gammaproteobacteria bacterium]|jgi:rhodanese-related sulfurtransferase|nr:rhodanese-like domain-containing protein [Gammaproteobacteria bacterium]MBT3721876.1 rhodanese-like domain-containing protein [Gammaproteobacteria bacterium]MBT4076669.1 rhodanese-like domain-containing protein [Gammaproteobacteria bacterium]MBT4196919.1 rhodanese-like domain-containing protein [Gammaproteobacteria bacterium]MBT4451365.1 rhodanese-like domain-containing protein [Gammaproteobacteria bacterium]
MKLGKILTASTIAVGLVFSTSAFSAAVNITPKLESVTVQHGGKSVKIMRNQNQKNTVNPAFAKTSRKCPPFCIQPSALAPGVETIGEVEVINYLKMKNDGDDSILVVDSRTPDWAAKGTIPGAVNLPWTKLNPAKGADPISIGEIMEGSFNAQNLEGLWDYSKAKTLVMFCNGMWCGQSPNNIKNLLKFGYPSHKIKWYRGGMQDWEILGLSTAKAAN